MPNGGVWVTEIGHPGIVIGNWQLTKAEVLAMPKLLEQVQNQLRTRHYSYRTEKTYLHWIKKYILFHGKRHPAEMGATEVTEYLTHLAVSRSVAASTQNQALSAILFLYRNVLGVELPWLENVTWAKRPTRLPVVLTKVEVRNLRAQLNQQNWLMAGADYKNLDLVFATGEGQPLIRLNVVQKHFKPILERAKLPSTLRLYDLRHSCATLLLAANENPKVVSERLGHASITLTMDTYSHVMPDMQQGASDKLERMLFTKTGTQ